MIFLLFSCTVSILFCLYSDRFVRSHTHLRFITHNLIFKNELTKEFGNFNPMYSMEKIFLCKNDACDMWHYWAGQVLGNRVSSIQQLVIKWVLYPLYPRRLGDLSEEFILMSMSRLFFRMFLVSTRALTPGISPSTGWPKPHSRILMSYCGS